jgi:hypothetical protein
MNFNTDIFMNNIGCLLGNNITFSIDSPLRGAFNQDCQKFNFEFDFPQSGFFNGMEMSTIPLIKDDRDAVHAAIYIASKVKMGGHTNIILGMISVDDGRYTLFVQPYGDDDMVDVEHSVSSVGSSYDLENCFDNMTI